MAAEVQVLDDPVAVATALSPLRRRILDALDAPDSATGVAKRLDLSRQTVNYHLRILEHHGLVELVEERQRRGRIERIVRRRTDGLLLDPSLADPASERRRRSPAQESADAWSAAALTATAGDAIRDVGRLARDAAGRGRAVPTASATTDVTFASADDLQRFLAEFAALCARHDAGEGAQRRGRRFRVALLAYPSTDRPRQRERG